MKGTMKKKLVSATAAAAMLASSMTFTAVAESNSITKIYADTKGMDIVFANAVDESDYSALSFEEFKQGTAVSYTSSVEEKILHLHFTEDIDTDTAYKLTIGGTEKAVTVKQLMFEDFEDETLSTKSETRRNGSDENGVSWNVNSSDTTFMGVLDGSKYQSEGKKLALTDGVFRMANDVDASDISISADVQMYEGRRAKGDGTLVGYTVPTGHLFVNATGYPDSYGIDISKGSVTTGIHNYTGNSSYEMVKEMSKTFSDQEGLTYGLVNDGVTETTVGEGEEAKTKYANDGWNNITYTISTYASEHSYHVRGYDNIIGFYYDGDYKNTVTDNSEGKRFTKGNAGFQSNAPGFVLIDNVLITTSVVSDIEDVKVTSVYADGKHVEVKLDKELGDVAAISESISIEKIATGEKISLSDDDLTISGDTLRINAKLERDVMYKLTIDKKLSAAAMLTEDSFVEFFKVKTLWYQDFETMPEGGLVNNIIRSGTSDKELYPVIIDGKLVTYNAVAPMAKEVMDYENVTFTTNMEVYGNLSRSEFDETYDRQEPYMYVAFNAQGDTISTGDLRFSIDNFGNRKFGWIVRPDRQLRFHNWADDLVVVTPEAGSSYTEGDKVSDKSGGGAIIAKWEQQNEITGIGKVDYGQHYGQTLHTVWERGDACISQTENDEERFKLYEVGDTLPKTYKKSNGAEVTVSEKTAQAIELSVERHGSSASLVYDGVVADTYETKVDSMKTGYFGISPQATNILAFEDMSITTYEKVEYTVETKLVYADKYGVVLENLGKPENVGDAVELYDINKKQKVEIKGSSVTGENLFVEADLATDKPYRVTVKSMGDFGDKIYTGEDYSADFMVKTVLNVEPTIESMKQLNSGLAAEENKVVQEDGFVRLYTKSLKTPSYDNATIEVKMAYYADVANGSPYINNYFNHNGKTVTYTKTSANNRKIALSVGGFRCYVSDSTKVAMCAADATVTADEIKNGITETDESASKALYAEATYSVGNWGYGAYGCDRYSDASNGSASSTWDGTIKKEATAHTQRFVSAGDSYRLYFDGTKIFDHYGKMSETGYAQFDGSSRGMADFYGLTVTQMELVDEIELKVTDIIADAEEIRVTFDGNVSDTTDFSGITLTSDGAAVNAAYTATDKTVTIVPEGGIVSGAFYTVKVSKGFGPSEICCTKTGAQKNFKVTIYADADFAGDENSAVTFDGLMKYQNGAAMFTNGKMIIDSTAMAEAESYTVKYEYTHYAALKAGGSYNITPEASVWFNADKTDAPGAGYWWKIGASAIDAMSNNKSIESVAQKTEYGDAVVADDAITVIAKGEEIEEYGIMDGEDIVSESNRSAVTYSYEIQKSGAGAALYRNGALVNTFSGAEDAAKTGYFGITASESDVIAITSIQAYTFEEIANITISLDVANGKAIVRNYTDSPVKLVAVVACYNDKNGMISSYKSQEITAEVGKTDVPYTLTSTDGAKTYKAFCWDNLTNISPYCKAAVYEVK